MGKFRDPDSLSRAELQRVLAGCGLEIHFSDALTSDTLYEALREQQLRDGDQAIVHAVLRTAMRHASSNEHALALRSRLDQDLAGTGFEIGPERPWSETATAGPGRASPAATRLPPGSVFSFGVVVSKTLQIYFGSLRNFALFTIIALVFQAPEFAYTFLVPAEDIFGGAVVPLVISVVFQSATVAMLVYATVQELRGHRLGVGELLRRGFSVLGVVAPVVVLTAIPTAIGMALLIIPGLILMVLFWVAIPAAAIERPGVFRSIGRSFELTKGYRWPIFGIVLILIALGLIAGVIPLLIFQPGSVHTQGGLITIIVISLLLQTVFTATTAIASAVSYYFLRLQQEGADIDQIAAVFD